MTQNVAIVSLIPSSCKGAGKIKTSYTPFHMLRNSGICVFVDTLPYCDILRSSIIKSLAVQTLSLAAMVQHCKHMLFLVH